MEPLIIGLPIDQYSYNQIPYVQGHWMHCHPRVLVPADVHYTEYQGSGTDAEQWANSVWNHGENDHSWVEVVGQGEANMGAGRSECCIGEICESEGEGFA